MCISEKRERVLREQKQKCKDIYFRYNIEELKQNETFINVLLVNCSRQHASA